MLDMKFALDWFAFGILVGYLIGFFFSFPDINGIIKNQLIIVLSQIIDKNNIYYNGRKVELP